MDPTNQNPPNSGIPTSPIDNTGGPTPPPPQISIPPVEEGIPHPFNDNPVAPQVEPNTTDQIPTIEPPSVESQTEPVVTDTIVPPDNGNKKSKVKIAGAIVGILLLVGSVAAGVVLVRQNQETREKAASPEVTDATVEYKGNGRVRVTATANSDTTAVVAYLVLDGELYPVSNLNSGNSWNDEGPVTKADGNALPPNNYRIRFVPNKDNQVTGIPVEKEFIVPGVGAPAPDGATSGPPTLTGSVTVSPNPLVFAPNKASRIGITVSAQDTSRTDAVTAWLFRGNEQLQSLTIATAVNGWTNTDIWPGNIGAGNYTLKVFPSKGTTRGDSSQDFPVEVKADAPATPRIVGTVEADPKTFEVGSTRRISLHAVGDGNTKEVIAWIFKDGVRVGSQAVGRTTSPQWRNDDPGPQNYVGPGNYMLRFIPTAADNKTQGPYQELPIVIKAAAAGAPAADPAAAPAPGTTGDARCTVIEIARGGSEINPSSAKLGETLAGTVFCYTTDSADNFDKIRYTITTPNPANPTITQDVVAQREQSRDTGNKRFFVGKFTFKTDIAGSYTIKGWGHTPKKAWKGKE